MKHRRFMCGLIFQNDEEAWVAEDKLCAAGFEVMLSNHPDDFDECDGRTRYGMAWKDFDAAMDTYEIAGEFIIAIQAVCPHNFDEHGFVSPDHVPTRFSDFGECSATIDELNHSLRCAGLFAFRWRRAFTGEKQ
jgi:hypothetical protein